MITNITVYEIGDQFATMSDNGTVRMWEVGGDGAPICISGPEAQR